MEEKERLRTENREEEEEEENEFISGLILSFASLILLYSVLLLCV